ncbi:MAG: glycosyltransferase family 39 protein [Candidatus Sumerlaeia bacterium]|nr:glycosyltransferase family 39 protein [Candidatus Sumerlaeia bacterium]
MSNGEATPNSIDWPLMTSPPEDPGSFPNRYLVPLPYLLAVVLLLWNFGEAAIQIHDEGHFLLAAHTISLGVRGVLTGQSIPELAAEIHQTGGTLFLAAKPVHVGLLALLGVVTPLTASKALLLLAALTVGCVALIQGIGSRLFGAGAGWYAGLMMACTPLLLKFGITVLSPVTMLFFALLSFFLLLQEKRRPLMLFAAGVAAALSVFCHYNVAPFLLALLVGFWGRLKGKEYALAIGGGVVCLMAVEGALLGADVVLANAYPEFRSFFGELFFNLNKSHLSGKVLQEFSAASPLTDGVRGYSLKNTLIPLGWILSGVGIPGLIGLAVFWNKSFSVRPEAGSIKLRWLLGWIVVLPFVVWMAYPWKIERNFVQLLPGLALGFGVMMMRLESLCPSVVVRVVGSVLLLATYALNPAVREPSPIAECIQQNEAALQALPAGALNGSSFPFSMAPIWKWYLGPERKNRGLSPLPIDFSQFDSPLIYGHDSRFPEPEGTVRWPQSVVLTVKDVEYYFLQSTALDQSASPGIAE